MNKALGKHLNRFERAGLVLLLAQKQLDNLRPAEKKLGQKWMKEVEVLLKNDAPFSLINTEYGLSYALFQELGGSSSSGRPRLPTAAERHNLEFQLERLMPDAGVAGRKIPRKFWAQLVGKIDDLPMRIAYTYLTQIARSW